jgi:hypothetical protein
MARIRVHTVIDAPPSVVWSHLEHIEDHVDWMTDARAIRFTSRRHQGVGTTFDCDTAVGPFRLTDRMEVTEWVPRKAMGVRHVGLITGEGRFSLERRRGDRTRFTWTEQLHFPWWLGGPVGAFAGKPVLRRVWKKNLQSLKATVEGT